MEKIALITGASKGIGKALAEEFAKHGYSLLLIARSTAELEQLQSDMQNKYQVGAKILSIDMAQPNCVAEMMNAFKEEMGQVEVLVNNAGFGAVTKFHDTPAPALDGMLQVNIATLTHLTYCVLQFMLAKKRGKILNVASTAAFTPGPYMAVYYASKKYVLNFSKAIYAEYADKGIAVSVLCPGFTDTEFHKQAGTDKTLLKVLMPSMSAEAVAKAGYAGLMQGKPVIVPGVLNKMLVMGMNFTPSAVAARITGLLEKPQGRKGAQ